MRRLNALDTAIDQIDRALKTLTTSVSNPSPYPGTGQASEMNEQERQHVIGLMRINRVGEVAAQALYHSQALTSHSDKVTDFMQTAAAEEEDHLAWCQQRLDELGGRASLIDPLWYAMAWTLGSIAGLFGDGYNLGFVVETERQVESHLDEHLEQLPENDHITRAILHQMRDDECDHADRAAELGAKPLPEGAKAAMAAMADLMKWLAYRV